MPYDPLGGQPFDMFRATDMYESAGPSTSTFPQAPTLNVRALGPLYGVRAAWAALTLSTVPVGFRLVSCVRFDLTGVSFHSDESN